MKTTTNLAIEINPCAWDISISRDEDGAVDAVSVRRIDGLAFEHPVWAIADHVRATLAARGIDAGNQPAMLVRNDTVCVVVD